MRFARLAVASLPLVVLGALGAAGCSDAVPPVPRGAYSVAFSDPGIDCSHSGHAGAVGEVSVNTKPRLLSNAEDGADVECSVVGSGNFTASGKVFHKGNLLQIQIPAITAGATADAPATGSVAFASLGTGGESYSSDACEFYFVPNTDEGVDAGKLWVAFKCPSVTSEQSTCRIDVGYVILENCATGAGEEE